MATRISVYHGGVLVGRCDARCHHATTKKCHCICGGRLHGTGDDVFAIDLAEVDVPAAVEAFAARNDCDVSKLEVKTAAFVQLRLFPVAAREAA